MRPAFALAVTLCLFGGCSRQRDSFVDFEASQTTIVGCEVYSYGATIDGRMTTWEVPYTVVARTPDWAPGAEPPFPVSEAIRLASAAVSNYTDQPEAFQLDKVEYLHIGNQMSQPTKWFYLVSFERVRVLEGREFQARGTLTIPVLLDGTVIQGQREKAAS